MPGNFASAGLRCSWTVGVPGRWVSWVVHIQCREFLGNTTSWENVWRSGTMRWQMIIHDESEVQDMFGANDDMFVASLFHEMVETNARFGVICFPLPCTHCSVSGRSEKTCYIFGVFHAISVQLEPGLSTTRRSCMNCIEIQYALPLYNIQLSNIRPVSI